MSVRTLIGGWVLAVGAQAVASPLAAQACFFCAQEVVLTAELGACFLARFEVEMQKALHSTKEYHVVELYTCVGNPPVVTRPHSMPDPRESSPVIDLKFLIEPSAMACLAELVRKQDFNPEWTIAFDVAHGCGD